jgi:ferredoxin
LITNCKFFYVQYKIFPAFYKLNLSMDQNLKDSKNPSGPVTAKNLTLHVDRDLCIGAATCIAIAPQTFTLDSEAKAIILDTVDMEKDEDIIDAARGCPTAAIIVKDLKGNVIFPQ